MTKKVFDDSEYVGNIWGWKNTKYFLIFILSILSLMFFLQWRSGEPFQFQVAPDKTETPSDSSSILVPEN